METKHKMLDSLQLEEAVVRRADLLGVDLARYLEAENEAQRAASWVMNLLVLEMGKSPGQKRRPMTWPPPDRLDSSMEPFPGAWKKGLANCLEAIRQGLASMEDRGHDQEARRELANDVAEGLSAVAMRQAVAVTGYWPTVAGTAFQALESDKFNSLAVELISWINKERAKDPVLDVKA